MSRRRSSMTDGERAGVAAPALSSLRGVGAGVALAEALDASGAVHQLLLAREIRVAVGADLHVDVLAGGAGLPGVAAGAVHRDGLVVGMDVRLHGAPASQSVSWRSNPGAAARPLCAKEA